MSEALTRGQALGGIVVVQTTGSAESRKRLSAFAAGTPYFVHIKGFARGAVVDEKIEVCSIAAGVDANIEWSEVERLFCEARCMISNTGDRGYEVDPDEGSGPGAPRFFPAKLAKLLLARHRAGAAPMTLLPCELVPSNGKVLRASVLGVIDRWGVDGEARRWIAEDCVWANSLVDRIVSQPLEPAGAVAEPYALWAIEDQPGLEPPCSHANIIITKDLRPYERLKLFILNLGHSYLTEIWTRRGGAPDLTVREMITNVPTRAEFNSLYEDEVLPVFAGLGMEAGARDYLATVVERFSNPFLDHRLSDIFVNHAAKKRHRFGGLIDLARVNGLNLAQPRLTGLLGPKSDRTPGLTKGSVRVTC